MSLFFINGVNTIIKIALAGMGNIGQMHMEQWSKIEGCEIAGIVGRNQEKLKRLKKRFGVRTYTSLEDLLKHEDVDVVDICLPTFLHYEYAKTAAEAEKHIICEKPLGINTEEARSIIDLCEQQKVQLHVGHILRFFPEYAHAHKQVKKSAVGKPGVVRLSRGTSFPRNRGSWYADAKKSGGIIFDLGIHDFDWLLWTFGDVKRIMARHIKTEDAQGKKLEYALAILKMENGTIAHVELSWAKNKLETSFEITGDQGMLTNKNTASIPVEIAKKKSSDKASYLPDDIIGYSPLFLQLKHFKECILGKQTPIITPEEALKAVEVAEAVSRSAASGKPVYLGGDVR